MTSLCSANATALLPRWDIFLKPAPLRDAQFAEGIRPRLVPRFDTPPYVDDFDADDSGAVRHVIAPTPA